MKTHWQVTGNQITATRGGLSSSVEVPIRGSYTNARLWLSLLRYAVTACQARLEVAEYKNRK